MSTPKLCLNMIVKNESKIIRRLFDSVSKIIDSYCICDTGSTDGTPEIIQAYFESKGISGKVYKVARILYWRAPECQMRITFC